MPHARHVLADATQDPAASLLNNLALLLYVQGTYAEARPLLAHALTIYEQELGSDHPAITTSLNNLAVNYAYEEQFAEAAPLMRRALAIWERVLGPDHPDTQSSRQSLAAIEARLTAAPRSAEAQIAQITQQAEAAVAAALADDTIDRAALTAHLEAQAQWAEDGEQDGSSYLALAAHLRVLAARLRQG